MPTADARNVSYCRWRAPVRRCALALALVAVATNLADELPAIPDVSDDSRPRIAVAVFTAASDADPRDAWVPTALRELLTWRLRRVPGVTAIPTLRQRQALDELAFGSPEAVDAATTARSLGRRTCSPVVARGPRTSSPSHLRSGRSPSPNHPCRKSCCRRPASTRPSTR
jgi:hypothetical protein